MGDSHYDANYVDLLISEKKKLGDGQKRIGRGQFLATVLIVDTLLVAHLEYLASEYTV